MNNKRLIDYIIVLGALFAVSFLLTKIGFTVTLGLVIAFVGAILLFFERSRLMGAILVANAMMLQEPTKQKPMVYIFLMLYALRWIYRPVVEREKVAPIPREYFLFLGFGIVSFLTGVYRGFLRGVSFSGGATYFFVLLAPLCLMVVAQSRNILSERQMRRIIILCVIASGVPFFLELLISYGHYFFVNFLYLINLPVTNIVAGLQRSDVSMRYRSSYLFSMMLVCGVMWIPLIVKKSLKRLTISGVLTALAVWATVLSGYRTKMVGLVMLIMGAGFLVSQSKGRYFTKWLLVGTGALLLVYMSAGSLPRMLQRQVSFLPGIQVADDVAIKTVEGSTRGRIKLYEYTWDKMIENKYYLIGRGAIITDKEMNEQLLVRYGNNAWTNQAYLQHNYHSMFMNLLIDNGVIGCVLFILFVIVFVWKRITRLRCLPNSLWRDAGLIFLMGMVVHNIVYLTFDVSYSEYIQYNILFILLTELSIQQLEARETSALLGVEASEEV